MICTVGPVCNGLRVAESRGDVPLLTNTAAATLVEVGGVMEGVVSVKETVT